MILFFYGPNTFLSRRKVNELIEQYVKKNGNDFGVDRLDGSSVETKSLIANLQATPFLAKSRLIIIKYLSENKAVAGDIKQIVASIPAENVVVFFEAQVDQRSIYFKELKKTKAVEFKPLAPPQLKAWIKKEVEAQGGKIDPPALDLLVERVGDDQWRAYNELSKIVNFDPSVSRENVEKLVEPSFQQSIFDLVDAMSAGDRGRALELYHGFREERTEDLYILTMITWQLRNLLLAKTAGNISQAELAKQTGMSPFVAGKSLAKAKRYEYESLKGAFLESVQTNYDIKTGKADSDVLLEQLIYKISTGLGKK